MTSAPKFFTWVEGDYAEPAAVPVPMRAMMRGLWLQGVKPLDIAQIFKVPEDWVEDFVRDGTLDGNTKVTH